MSSLSSCVFGNWSTISISLTWIGTFTGLVQYTCWNTSRLSQLTFSDLPMVSSLRSLLMYPIQEWNLQYWDPSCQIWRIVTYSLSWSHPCCFRLVRCYQNTTLHIWNTYLSTWDIHSDQLGFSKIPIPGCTCQNYGTIS